MTLYDLHQIAERKMLLYIADLYNQVGTAAKITNSKIIGINSRITDERQEKIDLAHELGHCIKDCFYHIRPGNKFREMEFWTEKKFEQFISVTDNITYKTLFLFLYLTGCGIVMYPY